MTLWLTPMTLPENLPVLWVTLTRPQTTEKVTGDLCRRPDDDSTPVSVRVHEDDLHDGTSLSEEESPPSQSVGVRVTHDF